MDSNPHTQRTDISSLLFRVRTRLCAIPLAQVIETMRPLPIEPLTREHNSIKGVAIIRGEPLPVVELAVMLGDTTAACTRFVKVKSGDKNVVLAVDSVLGIRSISSDSLQDLPTLLAEANNDAVAAIGTLDAELLLLLNAARLVPDSAWQELDCARVAS